MSESNTVTAIMNQTLKNQQIESVKSCEREGGIDFINKGPLMVCMCVMYTVCVVSVCLLW